MVRRRQDRHTLTVLLENSKQVVQASHVRWGPEVADQVVVAVAEQYAQGKVERVGLKLKRDEIAAAIAKEGKEKAKKDNGKAGKASTEAVKAEGGEVLEAAPQAAAKATAKAKTKAKAKATAKAQATAKCAAQNATQNDDALGAGVDAENDDVVRGAAAQAAARSSKTIGALPMSLFEDF